MVIVSDQMRMRNLFQWDYNTYLYTYLFIFLSQWPSLSFTMTREKTQNNEYDMLCTSSSNKFKQSLCPGGHSSVIIKAREIKYPLQFSGNCNTSTFKCILPHFTLLKINTCNLMLFKTISVQMSAFFVSSFSFFKTQQ